MNVLRQFAAEQPDRVALLLIVVVLWTAFAWEWWNNRRK